jgi:hypothetical protein
MRSLTAMVDVFFRPGVELAMWKWARRRARRSRPVCGDVLGVAGVPGGVGVSRGLQHPATPRPSWLGFGARVIRSVSGVLLRMSPSPVRGARAKVPAAPVRRRGCAVPAAQAGCGRADWRVSAPWAPWRPSWRDGRHGGCPGGGQGLAVRFRRIGPRGRCLWPRPGGLQVPGAVMCRRAVRARSRRTASTAVSSAAPAAIRAICQPGMPPVWITTGGVTPGGAAGSGGGKVARAAGAAAAKASAAVASPARMPASWRDSTDGLHDDLR